MHGNCSLGSENHGGHVQEKSEPSKKEAPKWTLKAHKRVFDFRGNQTRIFKFHYQSILHICCQASLG
ncbi:uncharacterized protein IAS62_003945 [Cryptococcus decagattii]|uniref:Uncharacterized protein n=1 Tax=Cryptococcus decagattii TaxID=1859122 RepID=A0ABZ2AVN7_9TREE